MVLTVKQGAIHRLGMDKLVAALNCDRKTFCFELSKLFLIKIQIQLLAKQKKIYTYTQLHIH